MSWKLSKSQARKRRGTRAASSADSKVRFGATRWRHAQKRAVVRPCVSVRRNPVPPHAAQAALLSRSSMRLPASVQVALQLLALLRAVQLLQGLGLDLADALARQPHHLADLLQGLRVPLVEPEPQAQHLLLLRL